jgi:cobalt-zinc-cadmium efflux system membrane fusion protein
MGDRNPRDTTGGREMKRTILLIAAVAVLSATLTYVLVRSTTATTSAAKQPAASAEPAEGASALDLSGLRVEPALAGESWDQVVAAGKVLPNVNKVVKIGPRISGKIVRVYADIGKVVSRGETLAVISSMELAQARSAYSQAAARVGAAKAAYDRQAKLAKLGAFTSRPVEEASSEHAAAQSELAQAHSELARSKSELVRAESELAQCQSRLGRSRELYKDQIVSRQDVESAEAEFKRDKAGVEVAEAGIRQSEARVKQAESRVGIAKSYLAREEKVLKGNHLASKEIQSARADLNAAELDLRADTIKVLGASPAGSGDTISITSPIAGKVVSRAVNLGEMVEPSGTLFTVMNLSDVWVEASIYEKDLAKIRTGQTAEIRVNSYSGKVFRGKVTYIGDILDAESRTAKVRCEVSNRAGLLKPEMYATVGIVTARRGAAVLIPREAVLDDSGKKIVFMPCTECDEDKKPGASGCGNYDRIEVETGATHGVNVEILAGIMPGDKVVTTGAYQLKTALGSGKLEAGCAGH